VAKAQERVARLDAESQARRAKVEEDFDIAQRARRAEAARIEEERERVSTQAARQRIAAAEQHAAQLVAEAEARAEAIREVRDELTGRLLQARQVLGSLPDLADRPQSAAPEADQRPPTPAQPRPAQPQPAQPQQAQPVQQAQHVQQAQQPARAEGEAAAARQPTRASETTRQLPMPPRTGAPTGGSTAAPAQPPPGQVMDQPVR